MVIFLIAFVLLLVIGVPISISIGASAVLGCLSLGYPLVVIGQKMVSGIDSFLLIAVPLFILAGNLMNAGKITEKIFDTAKELVGWIPGGLGHANVVASIIFAGMSGSAVADAGGLGAIEMEAMKKNGYDEDFAGAVTAASSVIGPIFPPSIPLIIYGSVASVSVDQLFMGGVVGRLFREFSVVLATAVLVSMVVSLTTTPMMCATLLRPFDEKLARRSARLRAEEGGRQGIFTHVGRLWGRFLSAMQAGYSRSLYVVLAHWKLTLTVLLLVVAANVWMYVVVPKGFFPQQDTGVIMGGIRADQSASFQDMEVKLARLVRILSADPAVDQVSAHISGGRGGGGVFISLKPLEERGISAQQVIGRLRGKMSSEPGLQIFLQAAQDIMMGGRSSRSQYQYTLQADDLDSLRRWGRRLQQEFAGIRILKDVDSDIEERGLQTLLTINRDALARLGLTMKDVDAALNNAFGQRQVSTIYEEKNQYRVVLEYALPWLEGEDSLGKVWLPGKDGAVPLLGVAEVSPAFAPLSVAHQGQFAAVTLSFNLAEGASLSQAQAAIDEARVRIGMPSTIVGSFQGTAKMYSDTVREQVLLILAALAALYIVLGVLYESLIHPLTILSTLPSAGIGALLALRACGMEFSVIALIGVLLLCGIVKKNAIMMIDFAIEAARTRNLPPREAIHEACRLRFRPIMMTTAAAILGAVPLALGQGDGAEIRQPLGITIVGGLLVSQLLTLYTTPVVYLCLDRARLRWRRRWWRLRYGERKAALLTALCRQG